MTSPRLTPRAGLIRCSPLSSMARVALFQMTSGIDPASNAKAIEGAIAQATAGGAEMLFAPEMAGMLDRDRKRAAVSIRSTEADTVLARTCAAAKQHGVWVALGSLAINDGREDGRWSNRSFVIDDTGTIRAQYDKIHLFDVDLPNGESWRESSAYAPGQGAFVVHTPVGIIGLSICYDIRFPSLHSALSEAGASILTVPSAFTVPTGQAHWHTLLRARAIENACWVIAAAQTGTHEDRRATYGHSLVVSPWGEVVLDMGESEGLAFAEIDLAAVDAARARIPVIAHRRSVAEVKVIP